MIIRVPQHGFAMTRTGGFTLVELVVAVAITSVLMLGLGSAMLMAARAMPNAGSPTGGTITAAGAVEQMITELQYAISISQRSATTIEFAVADRNGNDVPETIRYEWSGIPGAPFTRQYNRGAVIDLLADVRQFDLSYDLRTITTETPSGNESGETRLVSYHSTQDLYDYPIKDTEWYAQYFLPALPGDATSWKVTRVVIQAKQDGALDGEAHLQLQLPTAGKYPSGTVLEEKRLLESTLLGSYFEHEFSFSGTEGLAPQQGLCIVLQWVANGTACKVRGRNVNVTPTNLSLAQSTNRGASWSGLANQSLLFTVYGTVTTAGAPQIQNTYHLSGVQVRLRAGDDPASLVQTGVRALNGPEVTQ